MTDQDIRDAAQDEPAGDEDETPVPTPATMADLEDQDPPVPETLEDAAGAAGTGGPEGDAASDSEPGDEPTLVEAQEEDEPEAPAAEAPEPVSDVEDVPPPAADDDDAEEPEQAEEGSAQPETTDSDDPFSGPGDWYVIHCYAGYENKVKSNLGTRIQSMQMQDKIFDVVVPMEDVMEIKGGRKQVVQKKFLPGYVLVKMIYDNDSWFVVRNTPGVTGFVASGTGQKPTPLSRREIEKILVVKKEEQKPAFRLEFEEGDVVRIISGPFADFNGTIDEINMDQSKVKVMVNIFDRETPVELSFDQVARV
ncbi:MAG TPA: transcription termination/antitermination protein NusG [Actinomycetota bacterium]|nr:transcription termination/antitermination protein NusG [Actinomycetota bacterium]